MAVESLKNANDIKLKMASGYLAVLRNQEKQLASEIEQMSTNLTSVRNEIAVCEEAMAFQEPAKNASDVPTT